MTKILDWSLSRQKGFKLKFISPSQTEIIGDEGLRVVMGPPAWFATLAQAPHERPMLICMLNWFASKAEGCVIWDVGANMGFYSALLAHFAGPLGKVVSFEPNPTTFARLSENLNEAGCSNVMALMIGLSDCAGEAAMEDTGESTSCTLEVRNHAKTFTVEISTGDALVSQERCAQPMLIKIDIEGHELKALRGMQQILASSDCQLLLCEVHFAVMESAGLWNPGAQIESLLKNAGFRHLRWVSYSHLLAQKV